MPDSDSRPSFPGSEFIVGPARLVNARAEPLWVDARYFVLRVEGADGGAAFRAFDAQTGDSTAAFDPLLVAGRLGALLGRPVEGAALPIERLEFLHELSVVRFSLGARRFECDLGANGHCRELLAPRPDDGPGVASPDGRWLALRRGDDLWLGSADGRTEQRLTADGAPEHAWAGSTGNSTVAVRRRLAGLKMPPVLCWSPDSRRLLTHRIDERRVAPLHLLQHVPGGGARPRVHELRYAMAGEYKASLQHAVFDTDGGATGLQHAPIALPFVSLIEQGLAGWTPDSRSVWWVEPGPWQRSLALRLADPLSGSVRTVLEERSERFVELGEVGRRPNLAITRGGDVLWLSRRDGYAHLYRFDLATGSLRNRVTEGPWMVRELIAVDEDAGCLWFTASGREPGTSPLFRRLYRVGLDGCGLTLLTPEDADHEVAGIGTTPAFVSQAGGAPAGVGPGGRHVVWTRSRPDLPPRSVVARGDGSAALTIVDGAVVGGDVTAEMTPEPFQALAADGVTPLFGTLFRPRGFDPGRRYALVDAIYPGPQSRRVATTYAGSVFDIHGALALAQRGLVVFTVDGRGTPDRSQAFLDASYGRLGDAGCLDDHVAVARQLCARHPWLDGDRLGIYGFSGGGYAATRAMLRHPEVYRAGVAGCGNHRQHRYIAVWAETYDGPEPLEPSDNTLLADRLRGALLLIHGELDDNVHPAHTLAMAEALIRADRDFEMLLVPNAGHDFGAALPYVFRRTGDFLLRHLGGAM